LMTKTISGAAGGRKPKRVRQNRVIENSTGAKEADKKYTEGKNERGGVESDIVTQKEGGIRFCNNRTDAVYRQTDQ